MLISIPEAAERLGGVPVKPLASAALAHGLLIRIGSSSFVQESELGELIERCRCQPKVPVLSSGNEKTGNPSTSSKTPAPVKSQRAQGIAEKLKGNSRGTSTKRTAKVVHMDRRK